MTIGKIPRIDVGFSQGGPSEKKGEMKDGRIITAEFGSPSIGRGRSG